MAPILKEPWEIELMREAGRIVAGALAVVRSTIRPGMTTADIDREVERYIRGRGAYPTFKGYRGFPASVCVAVNEEVVHGIPSSGCVLREGDILGIDVGATYRGYVGDAAETFAVGRISPEARRLMEATREALEAGIRAAAPGRSLLVISRGVQEVAEARGYSVVKKFVGHGVGQQMHEDPQVPNYLPSPRAPFDFELKPGMTLAIEPMVNLGADAVKVRKDRWTVVTADGKLSAHFEHTIAVTRDGLEVLTRA